MMTAVAVSTVVEVLQSDMRDEEVGVIAGVLERRGYTAAELAYATDQLLVDATLDKKLSFATGRLTAADFERVIEKNRSVRRQLTMQLRLFEVNRLVMENPSILSMEDFGVCGFDSHEQPLYRFCYYGPVENAPEAVAVLDLPENTGADRVRPEVETGPRRLGELLGGAQ